MHVFMLGGTGYIGSAVVSELLSHGYEVTGLARSERSAAMLRRAGCHVVSGDIRDAAQWLAHLDRADAVMHAAATFSDDMADVERSLIDHLLGYLAQREQRIRFVYTGGCWLYGSPGDRPIDETSPFDPPPEFTPFVACREKLIATRFIDAVIVHPAMVYDLDGGVLAGFIADARSGGPIRVTGGDRVRWPLVHRDDLASLYRLALDKGRTGADYHGVGEAARRVGDIARAIARRYGIPDILEARPVAQAVAELGSWARGYAFDQRMTGSLAKTELGWSPIHLDLIDEISKAGPARR